MSHPGGSGRRGGGALNGPLGRLPCCIRCCLPSRCRGCPWDRLSTTGELGPKPPRLAAPPPAEGRRRFRLQRLCSSAPDARDAPRCWSFSVRLMSLTLYSQTRPSDSVCILLGRCVWAPRGPCQAAAVRWLPAAVLDCGAVVSLFQSARERVPLKWN